MTIIKKKSFLNICSQIEKARQEKAIQRGWGRPTQATVKAVGDPSVSIWMWPSSSELGCLETVLWEVIEDRHPKEAACVVDACKCSGADKWPFSKRHKAMVRCFLGLKNRRAPDIRFDHLWQQHPDLIPLSHPAFKPFSDFLSAI
jgi:hypothetical protein